MTLIGLAALLTFGDGGVPAVAEVPGVPVAVYQVLAARRGPVVLPREIEPFRRELRRSPYRHFRLVPTFPQRLRIAIDREARIALAGGGAVRIRPHLQEGKPHLRVTLEEAAGGRVISWFDRPNSPLLVATPFRSPDGLDVLLIIERLGPKGSGTR